MESKTKKIIVIGIILIILYLILYNPITSLISSVVSQFAPDGILSSNFVNTIYAYLLFDILLVYFIFVKVFMHIKSTQSSKIFFYSLISLFIIIQLLFIFDRRYCGAEEYSFKYLMLFLLLATATIIISKIFVTYFKQRKHKLAFFWMTGFLAFIYLALDEMFTFHENFGRLLTNLLPFSGRVIDWGITTLYFVAAIIFFLFFFKELKKEYLNSQNKVWLTLFFIGIFFQFGYIAIEYFVFPCTEEYIELVAAFFYLMAVLFLSRKELKK